MIFKFISFILLLASLIFIFQNLSEVSVTFFNISFTGPIALSVTVAVLTGFLAGILFMLPSNLRKGRQVRKLKKENTKLEENSVELITGDDTPAEKAQFDEIT